MQPQADPFIVPVCHEEIEMLHQDQDILLINKPSGLLSLWGKHPLNKDSVHFRLLQEHPTATLVHRLDFGTSGIMIIALNKAVNAHIGKQFQEGSVTKHYTAILAGHVSAKEGIIGEPIAKDKPNFPLQKICYDTGKKAKTHYNVIEFDDFPSTTRVDFSPVTGRTHQLRIHSQTIGHSILGCDLYASNEVFHMAERLMLHAVSIEFEHPTTGKTMKGVSPCPF